MSPRWIAPSLAAALAAAPPLATAQSTQEKAPRKMERKPAEPVKPEGLSTTPKPPAELAQLGWFSGTWRCQGDVAASPMGPAHKSRATVMIRPDLGGYWFTGAVREDRTADNPHPTSGMFHETYDTGKKQFLMLWVDNHGGWATQTSRGWDGEKMVFEGEAALGGQTQKTLETFVKKGDRELSRRFEIQTNGRWTTVAEDACKKASAPGPPSQ